MILFKNIILIVAEVVKVEVSRTGSAGGRTAVRFGDLAVEEIPDPFCDSAINTRCGVVYPRAINREFLSVAGRTAMGKTGRRNTTLRDSLVG